MFGKRCRFPPPSPHPGPSRRPSAPAPPAGRCGDRRQVGTPGDPRGAEPCPAPARDGSITVRPVIVVEVPRQTWTDTPVPDAAPQPRTRGSGAVSRQPAPSLAGAGSPGCSTPLAEPRPLRPFQAGRLPLCYRPPLARDCRKSDWIPRSPRPRRRGLRSLGRVPPSGPRPATAATDRARAGRHRRPPTPAAAATGTSSRPAGGDITSPPAGTLLALTEETRAIRSDGRPVKAA